ncbi:unnamed protein product [Phytophthora fragariaefolia]|uniref:Unnamed protein product n=1 Tax=Phytophthora fragariaefolia TaxID=1490495 RepID=A0A9W6X3Y0_9STRA|nr:unnamed protein product [Phytophthora fragariaefolia]
MENRVKAAEDSVQRLSSELTRERETFKAAVASNTAQSRRLHNLLSASSVADVPAETQLRRRTEDLQERVKRLVTANRTLRARVKLEEMDPDTLVLVTEGALLELRDKTRVVVRDALKAADASRSTGEIADDVARAAFLVSALPSEMSPKEQAAKAATPPRALVRKRVRRPLRVLDDDSESDSDSSAQESSSDPKTSGDVKTAVSIAPAFVVASTSTSQAPQGSESEPPASNSDRRGHKSTPSRSPSAPKIRTKAPSRGASRPSSPHRDGAGASSSAASRAASRTSSPARGRVLDLSGKVAARSTPPPTSSALSSAESQATLALSDDDVEIVDVLPAVPPPPAGSREDASPGGATGDTNGQRRGPVLRSKAASSEFCSALLLEALEADDDDVLGLTELSPTRAQSTSLTHVEHSAASSTGPPSFRGASNSQVEVSAASVKRSASSRGVSRKQVKPPATPGRRLSTTRISRPTSQVVTTLSSMPGSDRGSQRPLPVLPPVAGASPIVRVSKQVVQWAQPFISPKFSRPGAAKCWIRLLNCRLPSPVPAKTRVPCTVATLEAFVDYTNPSHPWQRLRRNLPPQACLFDTTAFDPNCKVSQRAPVPLRLRGYWRMFRGFGNETTGVDAAKDLWLAYVRERAQRSDRLRQKLICTLWEWCLSDRFPDVETELMFEPSMPGFSLEHLTWAPKTADWVSELSELEEREPWRNGWTEVPAQHPYNTTFAPCNPSSPLFVPVGFSLEAVRSQVILDPSLDPHEISTSWLQASSVPSSPDKSSSGVPLLPTGPVHSAPTSDDQLRLLVQVATAAPGDVTEI